MYISAKRPPNGALNLFWSGQGITNIHGNFLVMDNKHRKIFVIQQLKGCKFVPKMRQDTFSGRQFPLGELICSPRSL